MLKTVCGDLQFIMLKYELQAHASHADHIAATADGRLIASGSSWDNTINVWSTDSGERVFMIEAEGRLDGLDLRKDGSLLVTAAYMENKQIINFFKICKESSPLVLRTLTSHCRGTGQARIRLSPDGAKVAFSRPGTGLVIASVETGADLLNLACQCECVLVITWSYKNHFVALLTRSGEHVTPLVWETVAGKSKAISRRAHTQHLVCMTFGAKSNILIGGNESGTVTVWDYGRHKMRERCSIQVDCGLQSVSLSPDDGYIVSGHAHGQIKVWDIKGGRMVLVLWEASTGCPRPLPLHPRPLPSHGACGSGQDLHEPNSAPAERTGNLTTVWSPDGRYIFSGCKEGHVLVLGVRIQVCIHLRVWVRVFMYPQMMFWS
jgi:WD40 repeat protein